MLKVLETPEDIAELVRCFYTKVYADDLLRPIFQDVAQLDLAEHLPRMNSFWESVLLGARSYHNNTYMIHHSLNQQCPLSTAHFDRWVSLFHKTVDERYCGPLADKAKAAVDQISRSMQMGILQSDSIVPIVNS